MKIIANIGINWNPKPDKEKSSLDDLKDMIKLCHDAGADYAKIQLFRAEQVFYHDNWEELYRRVLSYDNIKYIKEFADKVGIKLMATPMYIKGAQIMKRFNFEAYKIRERDNQNYWLIDECIKSGQLVLISNNPNAGIPALLHINRSEQLDAFFLDKQYVGISCHVPDVYKIIKNASKCEYIELHVKKDDECIDSDISITFDDLQTICSQCSVG